MCVPSERRGVTHQQTHIGATNTHSIILRDWLSAYARFPPLITIKVVTLVFRQNTKSRGELRMACLFIVVALTKEAPTTDPRLTFVGVKVPQIISRLLKVEHRLIIVLKTIFFDYIKEYFSETTKENYIDAS